MGHYTSLGIVLLSLFVPGWLPTLFTHALMLWPFFSSFASEHNVAYRVTFLLIQLSLSCGAIAFLSGRYASAIWTPQPAWGRAVVVSVITLLPLLLFNCSACVRGIHAIIALSSLGTEGAQTLESLYRGFGATWPTVRRPGAPCALPFYHSWHLYWRRSCSPDSWQTRSPNGVALS